MLSKTGVIETSPAVGIATPTSCSHCSKAAPVGFPGGWSMMPVSPGPPGPWRFHTAEPESPLFVDEYQMYW